jgi:hypothetical protein
MPPQPDVISAMLRIRSDTRVLIRLYHDPRTLRLAISNGKEVIRLKRGFRATMNGNSKQSLIVEHIDDWKAVTCQLSTSTIEKKSQNPASEGLSARNGLSELRIDSHPRLTSVSRKGSIFRPITACVIVCVRPVYPSLSPAVFRRTVAPHGEARKRDHFHATDREENLVSLAVHHDGEGVITDFAGLPENSVGVPFPRINAELSRKIRIGGEGDTRGWV